MPRATPFLALAALAWGCAAAPIGRPAAEPKAPDASPKAAPVAPASVVFSHDDLDAVMARARAEGKAVFVDAWAPWCHTCLSMQAHVLGDPSLAALADRVLFVAIDTDRPESAAFLERHAVTAWPTFFMIDPATDAVTGYWPGAASLRELRGFIDEGLRAMDEARGAAGQGSDATAALRRGHAAFVARDLPAAAAAYERAVTDGGPGFSRRSEALLGWLRSLYAAKDWPACARLGREHAASISGAATPADFAYYVISCSSNLPAGPEATAAREAATARLDRLIADPPPGASADDRADALSIAADARAGAGDAAGARRAHEQRLVILEQAAAEAHDPGVAATYDYARAGAYVALGRADEAVRMLEQREQQRPDAYEPPARLADVLLQVGRHTEALAAIDRALARSYGPRKLRYLATRADILAKLGDREGELAALRDVVKGHEALPSGHASGDRLVKARERLRAAEANR